MLTFALPAAIEAGACVPVSLGRSGGSGGALDVALTATPGHLTFASESTCASQASGVSFPAGGATTQFYVRGRSSDSESVSVTAVAAGGAPASASTIALPLVRRGRCTIPAGQMAVPCPITPAIPSGDTSRTFFVYQSLASREAPSDAVASCSLGSNASGPATLFCRRHGTAGDLVIAWQAASHGRSAPEGGWSVRHLTAFDLTTQTNSIPLSPPVNRDASFLIAGYATSGSNWTGNDHMSMALSNTNISLRMNGTLVQPNAYSMQVVEVAGAQVRHEVRGSPGLPFTTPFPAGAVPPTQVFALVTSAFTNDTGISFPCRYAFDIERTNNGIAISRDTGLACGSTEPRDVSVQVIALPPSAKAQQLVVNLASGQLTGAASLPTPVEGHESLVLLPGLGSGGLTVGRTPATVGPPGVVLAQSELATPSTVAVTRGDASAPATYRPFVLTFDP